MITNRCLCTIPIFAIAFSMTLNDSHAAIQTDILSGPTSAGGPAGVLFSSETSNVNTVSPAIAITPMHSDSRWSLVEASRQVRLVEPSVNSANDVSPALCTTSAHGEGLTDVVADLYLAHVAVPPLASSAASLDAPKSAVPAHKNADASTIANAYTFNSHVTPDGPNSHTWKPVKVYSLPEVSSLTLLAIGSVGLIMRRKKHT